MRRVALAFVAFAAVSCDAVWAGFTESNPSFDCTVEGSTCTGELVCDTTTRHCVEPPCSKDRPCIPCPTGGDPAELIAQLAAAQSTLTSTTIRLSPLCTYKLATVENFWMGPTALPAIESEVVIEGNGATLEVQASVSAPLRHFYVAPKSGKRDGKLTLRNLELKGGLALGGTGGVPFSGGGTPSGFAGGGGAGFGGAIFSQGELKLERVTLKGNRAQGGAGAKGAESGKCGGGGGGMRGDGAPGCLQNGGFALVGGGGGGMQDASSGPGGGGAALAPGGSANGVPRGAGASGKGLAGVYFPGPADSEPTQPGTAGASAPGLGGGDGGLGGQGGACLRAVGQPSQVTNRGNGGGGGICGGDVGQRYGGGGGGFYSSGGAGVGSGALPAGGGGGAFGAGGGGGLGTTGNGSGSAAGGGGGFGGGGGGAVSNANATVGQTANAGGGGGGFGGGGGGAGYYMGLACSGGQGGFGGGSGAGKGDLAFTDTAAFGGGNSALWLEGPPGTQTSLSGSGGGAGAGGAIFQLGGTLTVVNSTIAGNSASGGAGAQGGMGVGAGIFALAAQVKLTHATITANATTAGENWAGLPETGLARSLGGGVYVLDLGSSTPTLTQAATVELRNSIVMSNGNPAAAATVPGQDMVVLVLPGRSAGGGGALVNSVASHVGSQLDAQGTVGLVVDPIWTQQTQKGLDVYVPAVGSPLAGSGTAEVCAETKVDELGFSRPTSGCTVGAVEVSHEGQGSVAAGCSYGGGAASATVGWLGMLMALGGLWRVRRGRGATRVRDQGWSGHGAA